MASEEITRAILGDETPTTSTAKAIGDAAKRLDDIAIDMKAARETDTARFDALHAESEKQAAVLTTLQAKAQEEARTAQLDEAIKASAEFRTFADTYRSPSLASRITRHAAQGYEKGSFLHGVFQAAGRDADHQREGKAILAELAARSDDAKAFTHAEAWGKATLGTSDAIGGWIIPNAIVDEFITPATVNNIYRTICTVVPGVTAFAVDIPFRLAARTAATVVAFGQTKENSNLVYNGYTATMYTIARI